MNERAIRLNEAKESIYILRVEETGKDKGAN